jgi:hypothetical protein
MQGKCELCHKETNVHALAEYPNDYVCLDCYEPKSMSWWQDYNQKEEEKMIPESKKGKDFLPWLKKEMDMIVTIKTEFSPPTSPKITSFLMGVVDCLGKEYTLSLNETAWRTIAAKYGENTTGWVGKKIQYKGLQPMGKGKGHFWQAI